MFASKDINLLIKSVTPSNLFVLSVHDMAKEVYCYLLEVSMRQFFFFITDAQDKYAECCGTNVR